MGRIRASVENMPEFDRHKEVVQIGDEELGVAGFIALHRERSGFPSFGATRVWEYGDFGEALRDALRLSKLMSYKSAFAGFPYGGAKAVIFLDAERLPARKELFSWYAEEINRLNGRFVTGSDVGVNAEDVDLMREKSRFVVGHGVPAAYYTALGVLGGIETVLKALYGSPEVDGRTFALQGLGKTGSELLRLLHARGARIYVADIDSYKSAAAAADFPGVIPVDFGQIHVQEVDIFCPCALQHSINATTEHLLRAKAIVGSANNQMESPFVEDRIYRRGILYGVDYIVNSGGLMSVVDQYENGMHDDGRILAGLRSMQERLGRVITLSRSEARSPAVVADNLVELTINPQPYVSGTVIA